VKPGVTPEGIAPLVGCVVASCASTGALAKFAIIVTEAIIKSAMIATLLLLENSISFILLLFFLER
jgi:hypothetical protein